VKKLADYGLDDHPAGDPERAQAAWAVAAMDDCDECGDLRIELTVEEAGKHGAGIVAHLSPSTARRLRAALGQALRELGEPVD
jgi:predicted neutral ceramidase superfamily lipid hydrolase